MATYNFTIGHYPTKHSSRTPILTGQRFGEVLVIGYAGMIKTHAAWHCICNCGNGITISGSKLIALHTTSCGCLHAKRIKEVKTTHGHTINKSPTKEYYAFQAAKARCECEYSSSYKTHGQRGIEFRFTNFIDFFDELGYCPPDKTSVDRIKNDGHYEKGNVRWATSRQQARNKSNNHRITINGVTKVLIEWVEYFHHTWPTVKSRLRKKWCDVCAVSVPPYGSPCKHRK